ncbi:MAG: oxidoreductase [Candidatus Raymondbacteria bacterium RifOxyA12_full_50_37]|uniref:Oxidoreductase n=1 Tax=Candidatus Raymondbacteria bacterium RIFOXYD12_FULL_49_13 TaxID=1817890 RepID=A0A1F7FCF4_UNCRA|nr:MAG: oxidoreductase [Candidatus Raymondbacteria bacterium RifOxyA12_full_50_37]OGJ86260.1 MAG: oxidoreductase [Candidatus Raymondbacteria bacterium RIFOXYA2_FULL_49_16]OGJ94758.1 MAG: oxidoreductase [Candidatus Raymondbacteria bacterium RifOxyB12_full_50_8]OGJ95797.1 MAG: oxidoreductase [Candidatus Raymondbacteria bacterium RIFOXYC2_FULL_50_21]OGK04365.1 MAG: oxidoreductase [Candidatus Raymondbacteria bacterium RIFOXYD12_FULL_49_13]OGK04911.1 MAG: oxidoreductase [Candidatus Raymondbacteria 
MEHRKLRAGIVGGGRGAFIGTVHRIAATLDNEAELVAGALSSDPEKAEVSAKDWYLKRSYASFEDMAKKEKMLPDGIDFVMIATPNHMHYPVIRAFAEQGIHVVCDKPLAFTVEEAEEIGKLVEKKKIVFALTHNYTGYPLVREARDMARSGKLGGIRKVIVEYLQDWLSSPIEKEGQKQASWRTDPAKAGISCCVGDIGTHGENLLEYITGIKIKSVCADLTTFVLGRPLEDDANILLRLENGGKGFLTCSQIATGEENNLCIRIYGTKASIEWHQQEPNNLIIKYPSAPMQVMRTNRSQACKEALTLCRIPAGHPEGYLEAFCNIYRNAIADIKALKANKPLARDYPSVHDGIRGMKFVAKCVESSTKGAIWTDL